MPISGPICRGPSETELSTNLDFLGGCPRAQAVALSDAAASLGGVSLLGR